MNDPRLIFEMDLRGKDYIQARGLSPQIVKERPHQCESCKREEMLPAVLNIIENWRGIGAF
ncbi:MAG: hypothetical protein ACXU8A_00095 [Burkholderiaceae bacterium]